MKSMPLWELVLTIMIGSIGSSLFCVFFGFPVPVDFLIGAITGSVTIWVLSRRSK